MKNIFIFFFTAIFTLLHAGQVFSQAVICGRVKGKALEKIYVLMPINGFANETVRSHTIHSTIAPDSVFKITVPIKESYFVKISFDNRPFWLVLSPGDSVQMEIDFSKNISNFDEVLQIGGSNAAGIFCFNKLNFYPFNKFVPIHDLVESATKLHEDSLVSHYKAVVNKTISPFDSLFALHLIDSSFYTIIKYSLKNILFYRFVRSVTNSNYYSTRVSVIQLINLLNDEFDLPGGITNSILKKCYFNEYFYKTYFYLRALEKNKKEHFVPGKDTTIIINQKSFKLSGDFAAMLFIDTPLVKENVWGKSLYSIVELLPTLLNADDLHYFKEIFPNSSFLPLIEGIGNSNSSAVQTSFGNRDKIVVLDTTGKKFNSLTGIIALYKNKEALYIDLWASWCVPCKYEFSNGKKADSLLEKYGIKRLYISIDEEKFLPEWKRNIYAFNLEGNHFLAGKKLQESIKSLIYSKNEDFSVPRYILVDKAGKIVNPDAPRPSDTGELREAILKALVLEK